jgi:hypothetical protein
MKIENPVWLHVSCSTSAIGSSSGEHVDHLGDTKDEMQEWSQDHEMTNMFMMK